MITKSVTTANSSHKIFWLYGSIEQFSLMAREMLPGIGSVYWECDSVLLIVGLPASLKDCSYCLLVTLFPTVLSC